MLLTLRSQWEEIYPLNEQYAFVGLLALGRTNALDVVEVSETQSFGGTVVRPHKRRRHVGDFDSESTPIAVKLVNDDDEFLALWVA